MRRLYAPLLFALSCSTATTPPPVGPRAPERPDIARLDVDRNGIEDALEHKHASDSDLVDIEVVLKTPTLARHLEIFHQQLGVERHVFRSVSYGWTGRLPRAQLTALAAQLGNDLLVITESKPMQLFLDEATRSGRVRPAWAANFAGTASGFSGASTTTIAILDTGVDGSHTDLAGRMVGWHDYTSDAEASAVDYVGHGTHVTGIALGTGAAFATTTGTGTLPYTVNATLTGATNNQFADSLIHTPIYFDPTLTHLGVSYSATWSGTSSTISGLVAADTTQTFTGLFSATSTSPYSNSFSGTLTSTEVRYQTALQQNSSASDSNFAVATSITNYPGVGDGFNALRGVAPGTQWYGCKTFPNTGAGSSTDEGAAIDDMVTNRATNHVKVINISSGETSLDPVIRAQVNTAVSNGVVVVISAGNGGPTGTAEDPGLAAKAITVGAANDQNALTSYSSAGLTTFDATEDLKPDLIAPGGSSHFSSILSVDSNNSDGTVPTIADLVPNDYASMFGTSMAAPFVAGAAALVIQALESQGVTWDFTSSKDPLLVKLLLLASATETNLPREASAGSDPPLGRAAAPKDQYEGYGMINVDAAIEAVVQSFVSPFTGTINQATMQQWERRAFGRHIAVTIGTRVDLSLAVPTTGDYDLYLYSDTPDAAGNPVILASSTTAASGGTETIGYTATTAGTAYVFVKRVTGTGAFTLTGTVEGNDDMLQATDLLVVRDAAQVADGSVAVVAAPDLAAGPTVAAHGGGCAFTTTSRAPLSVVLFALGALCLYRKRQRIDKPKIGL